MMKCFSRPNFRIGIQSAAMVALVCGLALNANADTITVVNDSFADGITNTGGQIGFATLSSSAGLDTAQAPGPVDFASGSSGRAIGGLFAAQTLAAAGDALKVTFSFTTPATIGTANEDFRFGLFNTATATGTDTNTGVAYDFTNSISVSSGNLQPGLDTVAGFYGEIDNVNVPGTDLGIRTHNVNNDAATSLPGGQFLNTTTGFDQTGGGPNDVTNLLPNSDYVGSLLVQFASGGTDLTAYDITVEMSGTGASGAFVDTFTDTVAIADNPGVEVGVNTNTFDLLTFQVSSGLFGSSNVVNTPDNGMDISNVTIEFTSTVPEPSSLALLSLLGCAGFIRRRR